MATYCDLISSGLTLSCTRGSNIGGVAAVWLTSLPIVTGVTENSTHVITGITTATISGISKFFKYEVLRESCEFLETINADPTKGILYYTPEVKLFFSKRQTSTRNQIALMAKERMACIVLDNNGVYWLVGVDIATNTITGNIFGGLDVDQGSTANAGKAASDANGYFINLKGQCKDMAREISASLITTTLVDAT